MAQDGSGAWLEGLTGEWAGRHAAFGFRLGHMAAPLVHVPPVVPQPPAPQPPTSKPPPYPPAPSSGAMTGDEFDRIGMRTLALSKSYVGAAFLTWFLYWLLYIPGLIMNIVYLQEANRLRQATGVTPSGKGCLDALLVIYVWVPLAVGILALILAAVGAINLQDLLGGF